LVTELIVLLGSIASGITTSFDGKNRKKKSIFMDDIYCRTKASDRPYKVPVETRYSRILKYVLV